MPQPSNPGKRSQCGVDNSRRHTKTPSKGSPPFTYKICSGTFEDNCIRTTHKLSKGSLNDSARSRCQEVFWVLRPFLGITLLNISAKGLFAKNM